MVLIVFNRETHLQKNLQVVAVMMNLKKIPRRRLRSNQKESFDGKDLILLYFLVISVIKPRILPHTSLNYTKVGYILINSIPFIRSFSITLFHIYLYNFCIFSFLRSIKNLDFT